MKVVYLAKARPDLEARVPKDFQHDIVWAGADGRYSEADLARVADADAFIVGMEPVHDQILDAAKNLKIVQRLGVGYETLDLEAGRKRGIPMCNIVGVNKEAVSEHGMTLILSLTKKLLAADAHTRALEWGEARMLTRSTFELAGKTIGIIGLGNTGSSLARKAHGFEMTILYNDVREVDPAIVEATGARFAEKEDIYKSADIISVNTDLNPTTQHLINAEALAMMKPSALLVCCARGGIIDEPALRDALNADRIAGAGIDVFDPEPITADNPLLQAKNTILTAHVAGVTEETTQRIFDWAHENVRRVVQRDEKPQWVRNGVN